MPSVTQRIKQVEQPKGGFLNPKIFVEQQLEDHSTLQEENIHPSLVGLAVDYLTRFMSGTSAKDAFSISLRGAAMLEQFEIAFGLLQQISGLNEASIIAACKLVGFDVVYRAGSQHYKDVSLIAPDASTIKNIEIMVDRSLTFQNTYGPIVKSGFTFEGAYTSTIQTGDGDLLTNDTLWEIKTTREKPTKEHTLQILIYFLMGKRSIHKEFQSISCIGIFNPRLNIVFTLNVNKIDASILGTVEKDVIGYSNTTYIISDNENHVETKSLEKVEGKNYLNAFSYEKVKQWVSNTKISRTTTLELDSVDSRFNPEKEKLPTYSIEKVTFDESSRKTKITFVQAKEYRTVERYQTINYQKFPIYSSWKLKSKEISYSIVLTNQEIECLKEHPEPLIRAFAKEIVFGIVKPDLFPSWLFIEWIHQEKSERDRELELVEKNEKARHFNALERINNDISILSDQLRQRKDKHEKLEQAKVTWTFRLEKIENMKKSFFKDFVSLFIRVLLRSKVRIKKIERKLAETNESISLINQQIKRTENDIKEENKQIQQEEALFHENIGRIEMEKNRISDIEKDQLSKVVALKTSIQPNEDFITLDVVFGMKFQKIMGCFIIQNVEKNKYYVGTSIDVVKRVGMLFEGSKPKSIFVEDYYTSSFDDKSKLFLVKLVPTTSIDEARETQKILIEKYDAKNKGYNKTQGIE